MSAHIVVLTHFPSPYQVELFDEAEKLRPGRFRVFYLHRTYRDRYWRNPQINHLAQFLEDSPKVMVGARRAFSSAPFAVINYYAERKAASLIRVRARSGRPWAFWGERPGYRNLLFGRLRRRWRLRALHSSTMPIWGIGKSAVAAYRQEFGSSRPYLNLPYFSDLVRFANSGPQLPKSGFVFLYSGTLSVRKGVDVLARAFARLAGEDPHVRLKVVGEGECETGLRTVLAPYSDRVEWIGFKDWDELPEIYASANALCVPSRYDGWGMVVPEGLAAGLPVISTNATGAALDLIVHGKNGIILPAGDETSLYEGMREMARLSALEWLELSHAARTSISEHSLENGARQLIGAVECMLTP
jgi:glycosyltransferase involved in cell wall biosynthesis